MNIIELAKKAGFDVEESPWGKILTCELVELERFAALVLKAEADETRARFAQPERLEREWVDLTDDELLAALVEVDANTARLPIGFKLFARAVIAAFKEKNK